MALETTDNRKEYAGNGATTGFSFPYYFLAEADLKVIQRVDATGVETLKVLTTHYTISGEGEEAGGTVTMLVAPPTGTTLVIYRDPAITQGTDFRENDSLPAESTEEAFDRAAMISQRLSERMDRAVRLSDGFSPDFDLALPSDLDDAAGKIPLVNEDSDGWAPAADWPDVDGVTAGMEAALAAALAAQAAAELAESHAELAETNAETAETNAELAETNAETAETNAAASAAAAAASAAAAAAALASAFFRDVVFFTSASSPVTITSAHNGKLLVFDSSGGAISVALPQISGLTLPFNITALCSAAGNNITFTRGGTDVFTGGGSTKVLSVANTGFQIAADTDPATDIWSVLEFGSVGDGTVTTAKLADANVTRAKMAAGAVAKKTYRSVTGTDSATDADDVLILSGASFTQTIPTAVGAGGRVLEIIHNGTSFTQTYTISGTGLTSTALHTNGEALRLVSDNTSWIILERRIPSVWASFTPTGSWSTNTTYTGYRRRVGDSEEYMVNVALAGAPTSAALTLTLPSSLAIDTAKALSTASVSFYGIGTAFDANGDIFGVNVQHNSSTVVNLTYSTGNGAIPEQIRNSFAVNQGAPFTFASGDKVWVRFSVPISGWNG